MKTKTYTMSIMAYGRRAPSAKEITALLEGRYPHIVVNIKAPESAKKGIENGRNGISENVVDAG